MRPWGGASIELSGSADAVLRIVHNESMTNILAISGSLRTRSSNSAILEAARLLAPAGMRVTLYSGIGALPHFNPDVDADDGSTLPIEVRDFRDLVGEANALLMSTPEYAHGLPGSFKNALDWLVGSTTFPGKLVAIINVSPRSIHAQAQLTEILTTMSAHLLEPASATIPLPRRDMDPESIARDAELSGQLKWLLDEIAATLEEAAGDQR
jgi:chromate reductase, NAD(P)H dehydrogenase (quinone)